MDQLTEEQFAALNPRQQDEYLAILEDHLGQWTLTPKQALAEELTRQAYITGYGGAAGGGKSDWGLYHVYEYCKKYPKSRWLILRTKFPELKRSLIARSRDKFDERLCSYKVGDKEWHFTNGSIIEFGYMDTDDDVYQYKSAEYDGVFIDEATEVSEFSMRYLMSRIRIVTWRRKMGAWPHMILCTNPGGVGHGWFKRDLVLATDRGEKLSTLTLTNPLTGDPLIGSDGQEVTRSTAFVPAYVWDNPHMPEEYGQSLTMMTEIEMRQLLFGDWDVFAGQFFTDWRHDLHVVQPFLIPTAWPRFRALDYGTRNPFCCLWAAMDWDSNVYLYREVYKAGLNAAEQAAEVTRLSMMADGGRMVKEPFAWTNADPAVFQRQGSGASVAQQWAAGGLRVRPAKNDRIGGWSLVRQWLKPFPTTEFDPELGMEVNRARLRVFPNCANLIRTIPDQIHDDVKVEDLHKNDDDHACDTLRYLAQGTVASPPKIPHRRPQTEDERIWADYIKRHSGPKRNTHPVLGAM